MPTRETFDRDLHELQDDLLRMGALVEDAVRRSLEALRTRSETLAAEVIAADNQIDALHLELEDRCLRLMGDHAEDIARLTRRMAHEPLLKPLIDIPRMGDIVRMMLREGLDAFVQGDTELAERMAAKDDDVDHLFSQVFRELLTYMIEDPKSISRATHLLMVAQALERIGDHATNIAERVIYMVTGTLRELNV